MTEIFELKPPISLLPKQRESRLKIDDNVFKLSTIYVMLDNPVKRGGHKQNLFVFRCGEIFAGKCQFGATQPPSSGSYLGSWAAAFWRISAKEEQTPVKHRADVCQCDIMVFAPRFTLRALKAGTEGNLAIVGGS